MGLKKYLVNCSTNFAGCDQTFIVEAYSESDAFDLAVMHWLEMVDCSVEVLGEATDEDIEGGYEELS